MRLNVGFTTFVFIAATVTIVFAHGGADGIVKERMDIMTSIEDQMKVIGRMIKGQAPFEPEAAASAARAIASHAKEIPEKFPEGSLQAPSEAHPLIWDEWEAFIDLNDDLRTSATALADAALMASDAGAIRPNLVAIGKTCVACHRDFRASD